MIFDNLGGKSLRQTLATVMELAENMKFRCSLLENKTKVMIKQINVTIRSNNDLLKKSF